MQFISWNESRINNFIFICIFIYNIVEIRYSKYQLTTVLFPSHLPEASKLEISFSAFTITGNVILI